MKRKFTGLLLAVVFLCCVIATVYADSFYAVYPGQVLKVAGKEADARHGAVKAGVYIGEGRGCYGVIQVEIKLDGNKLKSVQIIKQNESPGVGAVAAKIVAEEIVKHQSIAVDAVSGCTKSSTGVIAAVEQALEKSGVNIADFRKKPDRSTLQARGRIEKEADVIVIGAGGAGLAAAVSAHQNGAGVLVLERMPMVGGNTVRSGAAYNAVDPKRQSAQGIEDSIEKHYIQTYEGGDRLGKPEMVRKLVENAYPALEWLESMGMKFKDEVFTVLGSLWPRSHKPEKPLGTGYIETYMGYIDQHSLDIEVMLNTRATELIIENGRVVGVEAENAEGTVIARANNGVIIATGGFGSNIIARNYYNSMWPDLTNMKTTNHPGATGDGMWMAEKAGASLIGMEHIQLLPMGDPETGSLSGNIEQGVENRIFVNKDGNRFVDEGARRDVMTKALLEQKDSYMWVIVDKHSYPTGDTKNNFDEAIDLLMEEGRAYRAYSLKDLADQIGVDSDNLAKSVDTFNKAVEKRIEDPFGRTLFKDKIDTPPFYAGARVPTVHHTMGGIEINTKAQVLDGKGNVIPGLYAAGEVTGGIHGSNRLGGNALSDTVVFGKTAGKSAAKSE